MKIALTVISFFILLVLPQRGWTGDYSPLQISFLPPYQLVSAEKDVYGLRLNLPVGDNVNIYGLDLGVMGVASESNMGIMLNLFSNYNSGGSTKGIQIGGMGNVQYIPDMQGIQIAGLINLNLNRLNFLTNKNIGGSGTKGIELASCLNLNFGDIDGIQLAGLANTGGEVRGIQIAGLFNRGGEVRGIQLAGLLNIAESVRGIQIGLINGTEELSGLQIGLLNYISESPVPILPIINLKF